MILIKNCEKEISNLKEVLNLIIIFFLKIITNRPKMEGSAIIFNKTQSFFDRSRSTALTGPLAEAIEGPSVYFKMSFFQSAFIR
jgi:hypothetical protein